MFHEVAHGLGIKNTIDGKGTVRAALKERYSALEEGKADILGLYMVRQLNAQGELGKEAIEDNYVTFLASLFRSVRFGAADAHGRANIVAFNFFERARRLHARAPTASTASTSRRCAPRATRSRQDPRCSRATATTPASAR